MKKQILVLAGLAAIVASPTTVLAASSDPTAGVKADIATLLSISKTQHDLVIGDAQSIAGATDLKAALATLHSDRQAAVKLLQAQRDQITRELNDLRSSKVAPGDLKDILQQANSALKTDSQEVKAAIDAAKTAGRQAGRQAKQAAEQAARQAKQAADLAARQVKQQAQQAAEQAKRLAYQKALQDKQAADLAARQAKQVADLAALKAKQAADLAALQAKQAAQQHLVSQPAPAP